MPLYVPYLLTVQLPRDRDKITAMKSLPLCVHTVTVVFFPAAAQHTRPPFLISSSRRRAATDLTSLLPRDIYLFILLSPSPSLLSDWCAARIRLLFDTEKFHPFPRAIKITSDLFRNGNLSAEVAVSDFGEVTTVFEIATAIENKRVRRV